MNRFNYNKPPWAAYRRPPAWEGPSRQHDTFDRCDQSGFRRPDTDDTSTAVKNPEKQPVGDLVSTKLDALIDKFDKWDSWKEETDRRLEYCDPTNNRESVITIVIE